LRYLTAPSTRSSKTRSSSIKKSTVKSSKTGVGKTPKSGKQPVVKAEKQTPADNDEKAEKLKWDDELRSGLLQVIKGLISKGLFDMREKKNENQRLENCTI
jgi:hypothetical protein